MTLVTEGEIRISLEYYKQLTDDNKSLIEENKRLKKDIQYLRKELISAGGVLDKEIDDFDGYDPRRHRLWSDQ